jgi:hypothetical protein
MKLRKSTLLVKSKYLRLCLKCSYIGREPDFAKKNPTGQHPSIESDD